MLVALSAAMLLPAAADALSGSPNWKSFLVASAISCGSGAALSLRARCRLTGGLSVRQAFLLTPFAWTTLVLFGAIPLYISDYAQLKDSFTNAFFESMSGLTTTGATVIVSLDVAPPGILLWRALLQWLGGIGIVLISVVMLPFLRIGGMQLFRSESSDRSAKLLPSMRALMGRI